MINDIINLGIKYQNILIEGAFVTIKLCIFAWLLGIFIGGSLGWLSTKANWILYFSKSTVFFFSGIPLLVFLFWLYYPAQNILSINVDGYYVSILMLVLINTMAVFQIVHSGIVNFPKQYIEVGRVCGLSDKKIFFKIQLPLIARHIIPSLLTSQVNILHLSLFASLISVEEIFRVSQRIIAIEYKPVEIYTALGIIFLLCSLPINGLALYLKKRYSRKLDEK